MMDKSSNMTRQVKCSTSVVLGIQDTCQKAFTVMLLLVPPSDGAQCSSPSRCQYSQPSVSVPFISVGSTHCGSKIFNQNYICPEHIQMIYLVLSSQTAQYNISIYILSGTINSLEMIEVYERMYTGYMQIYTILPRGLSPSGFVMCRRIPEPISYRSWGPLFWCACVNE